MAHLPSQELDSLVRVLRDNGQITPENVTAMMLGLPQDIVVTLPPDTMAVGPRLETSLAKLNELGALADGRLPLGIVLATLGSSPLQAVVDEAARLRKLLEGTAAPGARLTVIDAFGAVKVIGDDVFAAREPLRTRLGELARDDGPPAVVVNGDVKVGKSHTLKLLAHAAHTSRAFRLAWVEIRREEAADFTADWLIEELVKSLEPDATGLPPRRTPVARWLGDLAAWAFAQLARGGTAVPVWLLIDGIGQATVTDEVRGVVERLAQHVALQTGPVRTRLILIDADIDAIRRRCVAEEERLGHLTAGDAEQALKVLVPEPQFATLWPPVQAALSSQPALTTPMVSAVIRESLK